MSGLIIDLFAGGGGASLGIEMATGRSPDIAINHDHAAIRMHAANHPETLHLERSVWKSDPWEYVRNREVDLVWASPDCFVAGTMILTDQGYRPIESIVEGDCVLTHAGRYRRVYGTMRAKKSVHSVDIQGSPTLMVSGEHPFLARPIENVWDNRRRNYRRTLLEARWVAATNLRIGNAAMNAAGGDRDFCATPCEFGALPIPQVGGRGIDVDERLMWLVGRYVGDGWSRIRGGHAELVIICAKDEADELAERLDAWPRLGMRAGHGELAWHRREVETAVQFSTNHRGLVEWIRGQFGHGGYHKHFPAWCMSAPVELRRALLAGYVSADGSQLMISGNSVTETITISKALALSTKAIAESLGFTATVSNPRANSSTIEGRDVQAKRTYLVRWRETRKRLQTVREGIHNWSRVQRVGEASEPVEVFNIAVEEDESYVADGIVVHNCKHHSKAKGSRPVKRNIRDLAWVVKWWAQSVRPKVIILENVEEFRDWGPVVPDASGRFFPCPDRKGETFKRFVGELRRLGYRVDWRELVAADYGAPTIRKRLYMIARRDGLPIAWPKPTHGRADDIDVIAGRKLPWRSAAEIIDWSLPCPSIFDTAAEIMAKFGLRAVRPLQPTTLRRVARGVGKYVIEAAEPFILPITHAGSDRVEPIGEPLRTTTAAHRGERALVMPFVSRQFGASVGHGAREPLATVTAGGGGKSALIAPTLVQTGYGERPGQAPRVPGLDKPLGTVVAGGQKHALVAAFMAQHNTGVVGRTADAPLSTVTATGAQQAIVAAHLSHFYGSNTAGGEGDLRQPARTVTAEGNHASLVTAFLSTYYGTDQAPQLGAPLPTVTTVGRHSLVTVTIDGATYVLIDIGMRMLTPRELFRAQGFPDSYQIEADAEGVPFSKTVQVEKCGNSVCPPVAAAIVAENLPWLAQRTEAA
ncbi:DNA cytosine methyltransferase [Rhodobium gokarnense]|uniref:DNA (cytosine-5-)-methyltransferase n=1 Tax=Rhodobium gokarnense TaxID=364296 RepID=A0ABT3HH28_9HYPH|nr:DNA cytosine methyltransferase [Rhodobium gokarnense]MCW2309699.1 site-specific DNA-cytosine methylase [Rhodobium gokarnense]